MAGTDYPVQKCDLATRYGGCRYGVEGICGSYSANGVAFRCRMGFCPLGNLPPSKVDTAKNQKVRVGQQHQKKEKRK